MHSSLLFYPYQYKFAHMSPYTPFRTRRGIHHFLPVRILENLWFFFSKSSWGMKIVLVWVACVLFGLFFPWIQIGETTHLGAFSLLCGGIGWWILILMIVLFIHFFSYDFSQKVQKISHRCGTYYQRGHQYDDGYIWFSSHAFGWNFSGSRMTRCQKNRRKRSL